MARQASRDRLQVRWNQGAVASGLALAGDYDEGAVANHIGDMVRRQARAT